MLEPQPGTYEAYRGDLSEAKVSKWSRNIIGVGGIAITNLITSIEGLTQTDRLEISAGGLAFTGIGVWLFERDRRQAIHNSHIDAALATIDADINGDPVPEWAAGNTSRILEPRHQEWG